MRKIIDDFDVVFVVFIVLLVVSSPNVLLPAVLPAWERAGLIALYNATDGDNWDNNSGWKRGPLEPDGFGPIGSEGTWQGITVSGDHVTEIVLKDNHLCGSIPPQLGNLGYLQYLNLSTNFYLHCRIPSELGNLTRLTELRLSGCELWGSIPPELGNLINLKELDLSVNDISSVPPELGNLGQLEILNLSGNIIGYLPSQLSKLTRLTYLNLSFSKLFEIPVGLGNLKNLEVLYLDCNPLGGDIPTELGKLNNLKVLDIKSSDLTGRIPSSLGNLGNLKVLDLRNNHLKGKIPPELGDLGNLEELYLLYNELSGNIPKELGNLGNLKYLMLEYNRLSGSIPPQLGNLTKLIYLYLHVNQLSGRVSSALGNLSNLEHLKLHDNQLSGSIPAQLGNLSNLNYLHLGYNQLTGSIPCQLGNLRYLSALDVSNNQLSGSIPPELGNLSYLMYLGLSHNQLSGGIPPELGNLTNLEYLYLDSNHLGGKIPSCLTNLVNLYNGEGYSSFGYNSLYTDNEELRSFLTGLDEDWEETQTIAPTNVSAAATSPTSINVSWTPIKYTRDPGGYLVFCSPTSGGPWEFGGITPDKSTSSYNITNLNSGTMYYFVVKTRTIAGSDAGGVHESEISEEVSAVTFNVPPAQDQPPFGSMDLPAEGNIPLSGSIAVCGWALDDFGVQHVKIYNIVEKSKKYIGDAIFIEGARPDIEQVYPGFPNNTKAGWGCMLLTNFLPNGGNGSYTLRAIAADYSGKETILGSRTIVCDNANAVKPFGAIDTPSQGGLASGSSFINFGWVLTPLPNTIPRDGSFIRVWIDGIPVGNPVYNQYRKDIAQLFPGYNNSDGAGGYFYLDTTAYKNGVHTIQWTASDDAGNTSGIGCRYFTIQNTGNSQEQEAGSRAGKEQACLSRDSVRDIPIDYSRPTRIRKGYNQNLEMEPIYPDENGNIFVEIKELEPIEIHFFDLEEPTLNPGYKPRILNVSPLLIGSTLDAGRGVFCWQPGPGFISSYRLVFIEEPEDGHLARRNILITITPKSISVPFAHN
jgi:Leucine-rich repeat (LRR) protein